MLSTHGPIGPPDTRAHVDTHRDVQAMDGFDALVRALMRRCAHVCGTDKLLTLFHIDPFARPIAFAVVGHCGLYGRCRSGLTFEVGPCPWGCLVGGLCAPRARPPAPLL
jgi:hypothetical protein